jgi:hypothetical protein
MKPVQSSAIRSIGHHQESNTLRIEFNSGHVYEYPNVTADEHQALIGAQSIGAHFVTNLRHRQFRKLPNAA